MYLSRLVLDPRRQAVRRDLANPQHMHRTLMAAFPPEPEPAPFRKMHEVLYRAESDRRTPMPVILVQSASEPDWSLLDCPEGYFAAPPAKKNISCAYNHLRDGRMLAFRLRANVTLCTKRGADGAMGKARRVPLRTVEECTAWLQRKGEQHGFALVPIAEDPGVLDLRVNPERDVDAWRGKGIPAMRFGSVLFEGRLRISDVNAFRAALREGVGRGKAYGFGLLSVRSA